LQKDKVSQLFLQVEKIIKKILLCIFYIKIILYGLLLLEQLNLLTTINLFNIDSVCECLHNQQF